MTVKKISSVQTYVYAVSLLVFAITVFGIAVYFITARILKQQLSNKCLGLASAVAAILEEHPGEYREFIQTLDTGSDYYIRTKKLIEKIRYDNTGNIIYLYSEVRVSEDEMMFVFDGEKEDSDGFSPPGSRDLLTITRRRAYETMEAVKGDFTTNAWGTLLTTYAPVFDADASGISGAGEFIGLVGADVSITQYHAIMKNYLVLITVSTAMIILMGLVIIRLGKKHRNQF
jgi:sensor histidine kinase regulating citrate/malate metabolism